MFLNYPKFTTSDICSNILISLLYGYLSKIRYETQLPLLDYASKIK